VLNSGQRQVQSQGVDQTLIIQGRPMGPAQLEQVRGLLLAHPDWSRYRLSRQLCQVWNWRSLSGQIKDVAARALLLKLEQRGSVALQARRGGKKPAAARVDARVLHRRRGCARLAELLHENNLAVLRVQPKRYTNVNQQSPFIARIKIAPVKNGRLEKAGKARNKPKIKGLRKQRKPASTLCAVTCLAAERRPLPR